MDTADLSKAQPYIDKLGIVFDEVTTERVVATMPVEGNTQPDGILHGGATCSLVETLASIGAAAVAGWPENIVVGQQQMCTFMRPATEGRVKGVAVPQHVGRTSQVWDVDVTSVTTGKRIASGRVILAVRPRPA
jgi:1,4-dihydroxy-2-naphthoyl-CoA hydrolase